MKRFLSSGLVLLFLVGCSSGSGSPMQQQRTVIARQDANALWNLRTGRDYVAQGRFELAKEHFLFALSGANDTALRNQITHELEAVELMIKTQR